eukprot:TRINITY_DN13851_c0_g1_i1.p1 TRINITY_DN13851_c0_g1~~TRINITY_DN13851_c0_g1_i1.p1  ORF type:complete len:332 (+),score=59.45 TRINITY_DN13851_c0_g1_i1:132-998(+)
MAVPSAQRRPARGDVSRKSLRLRPKTLSTLLASVATVLYAGRSAWMAEPPSSHESGSMAFVPGHGQASLGRSFRTARSAAAGEKPKTGTVDPDDFDKARERIRRIQLGLGPNDPLPPEGSMPSAALNLAEAQKVQPVNVNLTEAMPGNESEIAAQAAAQLIEKIGMDALPGAPKPKRLAEDGLNVITEVNESEPIDAFAGYADDVDELKPEDDPRKKGPNIFQALLEDLQVIRFPGLGEVGRQFGIVILMVSIYTGFIALVDFTSQQALGQVFLDFYKAARQEVADLG